MGADDSDVVVSGGSGEGGRLREGEDDMAAEILLEWSPQRNSSSSQRQSTKNHLSLPYSASQWRKRDRKRKVNG